MTAAWSSDPSGAGEGNPEQTVVLLLALVGTAYLLAHFVVDWLQRRLLFVSGFEYILLGIGLGYLAVFQDLTPLAPILALAAGWVGIVLGMELDVRRMLEVRDQALRLATFEGLGSGVLVAVLAHAFLVRGGVPGADPQQYWLAAGVMGCAGAAGSSTAIDLVTARYELDHPLVGRLRRAAGFGDLMSVGAFGVLFCIFHQANTGATATSASLWIIITVLLGLALGGLFSVFLGGHEDNHSRFLALVGIITFSSGAAFFLDLSLLTVNMILAFVVTNSLQDGSGVRETLASTRRPMSLVLLVFAGALWEPPWHGSWTFDAMFAPIAITVAYIAVRMGGKLLGCWVGAIGTDLRPDLARGLMAQGDEAIAMALSLKLVYDGPAIDVAYTAILGSVIVHELLAPRILKGLLVDAGVITRERGATPPPVAVAEVL